MRAFIKKFLSIVTLGTTMLIHSPSVLAAGLMTPTNATIPALEIKSHHVNVTIEDGYAATQVDQVFSNPNPTDLEATYSFPVPEKGAVSEFTVWIDGQPVIGEVLKKEQARKLYEAEKAAGREAGLTEKKEHYRFEVSVSPVRANQDVRIRMVYLQAADIDNSMGRYVYPLEEGQTDSQADAFWSYNPVVKEDFSFNVKLRSGYPVTGVRLPQHPTAVISNSSAQEWQVTMGKSVSSQASNTNTEEVASTAQTTTNQPTANTSEATPTINTNSTSPSSQAAMNLDKDIVVYWRLAPNLPGSIDLITHREPDAKRGTFMMTVTPGDDLAKITEGRDWAFVLDMSGSMTGKYQTMVDAVQGALSRLNPNDRFQLTLFDDQVMNLTNNWIDATPENVTAWGNKLASTAPRGSTNLYAGLEQGLKKLDADRTGAIILVTDGEANVGVTEKKKFLSMMEGHDVRLFTAVMGNGANRPLLNAMTEVSNGFAVSVSNSDDIAGKLLEFTSKVSHQALHDVSLNISGVKTADLTTEQISSLYRGEQLVVFGHYWGSGEATVTLNGKVSGETKTYSTRFNFPENETLYPEIKRLWAYAKIQSLQDKIDYFGAEGDYKNAIIDLAVENSLVTDHTSMIVMRDEQFAAHGIERKNKERREREVQAKEQRQQTPVQSHRVDANQPAFSAPRASHSSGGSSGGGSFNFWLLLPLALLGIYRKRFIK